MDSPRVPSSQRVDLAVRSLLQAELLCQSALGELEGEELNPERIKLRALLIRAAALNAAGFQALTALPADAAEDQAGESTVDQLARLVSRG